MKRILTGLMVATALFLLFILEGVSAQNVYRLGMKGNDVFQLQQCLSWLSYLEAAPTGYFGRQTLRAVRSFQKDYGLKVDGIVGSNTATTLKRAVNVTQAGSRSRWIPDTMTLTWPLIDLLWERDRPARVTDVKTGKTFAVRRFGGELHCDTEPLTSGDTRILAAIYGGRWSWRRRAVIVEVGAYRLAASINGYPHGDFRIKGNRFNGHFCIHFTGSLVHKTHLADPEHQRMIREAVVYLKSVGEGSRKLQKLPDRTVTMDEPGGSY